jgi:seryl-tRNA synthetase
MNKFPSNRKRPNINSYPYNYAHGSYTGYPNTYKKTNNYKIRTKQNNIQINNKYHYNNKFNNSYNNNFNFNENQNSYYSSVFQKNKNWHRYNPYFTEEKKISEEINNDSVNEEEKKEELLKIRVNVSDTQCKELCICQNDDINEKVEKFCNDNGINKELVEPLINKINQSLIILETINNNMVLNKNDYLILNKIKNFRDNINENN